MKLKNKNIIITAVLFGLISILLGRSLRPQKTEVKRPNILIIVTDDQDAETLNVYVDIICDTPNINKLASEGISFTSAHHIGSFRSAV